MRLRTIAGKMVRQLTRRWEALGHQWRRNRALRRLRELPADGTILMLCHGNICRSPYAARALASRLDGGWRIIEGGFFGPDRSATDDAVASAARRGIDLRGHRSRLATPDDARQASLLLVMEPRQVGQACRLLNVPASRVLPLGDLDPIGGTGRSINDPYGKPAETFDETYSRIDRCLDLIVGTLNTPSP